MGSFLMLALAAGAPAAVARLSVDAIIVSAGQMAAVEAKLAPVAGPARAARQAVGKLALGYRATHQARGQAASTRQVFDSPTAVLVERPGHSVFAWSEAGGGFLLVKKLGWETYSVERHITPEAFRADPVAAHNFKHHFDHARLAVRSTFATIDQVVFSPFLTELTQEPLPGGLVKVTYRKSPHPPTRPGAEGQAESGTALIDPKQGNAILELETCHSDSKRVWRRHESREYYPATDAIPHPLLKSVKVCELYGKARPATPDYEVTFTDYALAEVPAGRLAMGHHTGNTRRHDFAWYHAGRSVTRLVPALTSLPAR